MSKNDKIIKKILSKKGQENTLDFLSKTLSASELNSLLLEVFQQRSVKLSPSDIMLQREQNRFVGPVDFDVLAFRKVETDVLKFLQGKGYQVQEFSPVNPLGLCSVLGPVSQNKIISALRGTEVVSDVTNCLALEVAHYKKQNQPISQEVKLCATHRHVRGQVFDFEGFTAHFKVLGLVKSGRDKGNRVFECESLAEHVNLLTELLQSIYAVSKNDLALKIHLFKEGDEEQLVKASKRMIDLVNIEKVEVVHKLQSENNYYRSFQFKLLLHKNGQAFEIGDGGMVDWTQQLLQNKKERLMISGIGIEFLHRILED